MKKKLQLAVFFVLAGFFAEATHIVGGYMAYKYVSGTTYQITLTVFRNCNSSTFFDTTAFVAVYDASTNALDTTYSFDTTATNSINPPNNPCLQISTDVCVQQGLYIYNITLPSSTRGYIVAYQRCCRNNSINNILNPGDEGETFFAYIPPTATYHNSNPVFVNYPPVYICVNTPLRYDHSATDVNTGDVLRYSLCTPYTGANTNRPQPDPPSQPPYPTITWMNPYSTANMLGGNSPLTIDSITGLLTGTPTINGQFVVGVCVSQYRNGELLTTTLRDFQFNVEQCNEPVATIPSTNINPATNVGTYKNDCQNFSVTFQNSSYNPPPTNPPLSYFWNFGVAGSTTDTSSQTMPTYTYPDTGTYLVTLVATKGVAGTPCTSADSAIVRIYPKMIPNFGDIDTCANGPALFADSGVSQYGTINQWSWHFGDGDSSLNQDPAHTYSAPGNYTVQLIEQNSIGCIDTISKSIHIYLTSDAVITAQPTCVGAPVNFSSSSSSNFQWNFGNDSTSTQAGPTSTYATAGNYLVRLKSHLADGCEDSVAKTITVYPHPFIGAGPDTEVVCQHGGIDSNIVQLHAGGGITYQWSPGTGLSNPDVSNPIATLPGDITITYVVSVTDIHNCITFDSASISFYRPIAINAGPDTLFCLNPGVANNLVQLHSTGGVLYRWSPAGGLSDTGISNPVATVTANTVVTYTVTVTDVHECFNADSVRIGLYPSVNIIATPAHTTLCSGGIANINVQLNATGAVSYVWSPGTGLSNTGIDNPVASPTSNTIYYVTGTDIHGCRGSDSVNISTVAPPVPFITPDDTTCGQPVQLTAGGGSEYSWQPTTGLSCTNCANPVTAGDSTITYTVVITDATTLCAVTDSVTVTDAQVFVSDLFRDSVTLKGDSLVLLINATGGIGQFTYLWSPSTFLNNDSLAEPVTTPTADITYAVLVSSSICSDTASIYIQVLDSILVAFPTAFTPNGDGHDDYFYPVFNFHADWVVNEFRIYNRFGELIYSNTNKPGWDGRYKGAEQPIGTYVYYIDINLGDSGEIKHQGTVTLLR